jgi:hypothetical protein
MNKFKNSLGDKVSASSDDGHVPALRSEYQSSTRERKKKKGPFNEELGPI